MLVLVQKVPQDRMRPLTDQNKQSIFVSIAVPIVLQYPVLLMPAVVQKAPLKLISHIPALKKQSMSVNIAERIVLQFPVL
jgi:hypothetical protein